MPVDDVFNGIREHFHERIADVLAHEHPAALAVDDLALLVHDVIELQHIFAHFKVAAFQTVLEEFYPEQQSALLAAIA